MEEIIPVLKKNAVKAFHGADKAGKKLLAELFEIDFNIPLRERINTMHDVFEEAGVSASDYVILTDATPRQAVNVCIDRLMLLQKVFNSGKKIDTSDTSQNKYYPYFNIIKDNDAPGGFRLSFVGSVYDDDGAGLGVRPHFIKREDSDYVGKQFLGEFTMLAQYLNLLNQEL
jgi:hypothetical protein